MNKLEIARQEINEIDEKMAKLFERRMKACEEVAEYKREHGLSIRDEAREQEVINKNLKYLESQDIGQYYIRFLKNNFELASAYQAKLMNGMKVSYAGSKNGPSYKAAKKMFPEAELISCTDYESAYRAAEDGKVDSAVLPIENACDYALSADNGVIMDLLFLGNLFVNQVIDIDADLEECIPHDISDIEEESNIPKRADECDISNKEEAGMMRHDIKSVKTSRYAALSRMQNRPSPSKKREDDNFIIMFTVQNEAGALAQVLDIIGAHGYNMRTLKSCPMKGLVWSYYFYIESEGSVSSTNGQEMLQELSALCAKLKLIGTYYSNNIR